jgi:uncharacterized protein
MITHGLHRHLCRSKGLLASAVLLLLFFLGGTAGALEVPQLRGRVNDYANMISASAESRIETVTRELEESDSTQVVVLTIPSLEEEDLEGYSIRVAETWGIGQAEYDNGVLLLVTQAERRVRIEVGYGMEGVFTDLQAGRIIDYDIVPYFKAGRFDEGLVRGVEAIASTVRGEYKAGEQTAPKPRAGSRVGLFPFFILLAVISVLGSRKRVIGAVAGAILFPLVAWFALSLAFPLLLLFIPLGFGAGLIIPGLFLMSAARRGGRFYGGGSSSGGGFSGGGFSGGGGGFGGGGASGGW